MGSKQSEPAPAEVKAPSPEEIAAAQQAATKGMLDLQLQYYPQFTQADIERINALAPASANAITTAQDILLKNVQSQFPQFYEVLKGLGTEAMNRLQNIGQLPPNVLNQALEASRSEQATRGISGSPIGVAGTAGQIAALGQAQYGQDINLAQTYLNSPFAPNLPLTGVPTSSVSASQPTGLSSVTAPGYNELVSAFGLQSDIAFSNAALQRSNALLGGGGGGFNWGGAAGGAASGAAAGSAFGPWGTAGGAIIGGILGGF